MKIRKMNAAAVLGSLTASVALLAGMQGAQAQGAPGAGSYPGSFLVPGTQTSFSVTGFVQLLYSYDFSVCTGALNGSGPGNFFFDANQNNSKTGFTTTAQAGHHLHGCSDFTPGTSRINVQTRTPTAYGELKTFIALDFQGASGSPGATGDTGKTNSDRLRANLREAYGTLGPFLAGQTISNFRDASVEAEVIDNGGTTATGALRTPQVRYTFNFGNGLTLAVAAENAQTKLVDGADDSSLGGVSVGDPLSGTSDKIPDFTAKLQYDAPWGHVNLRGVLSDLYCHSVSVPCHDSTLGWGVGLAGTWNVGWGKDALNGAVQYGEGSGRFIGGSGSPQLDAVVVRPAGPGTLGTLKTLKTGQFQANYTHWWTDQLRTNVLGSYYKQWNHGANYTNSSAFSVQWRDEWYAAVNLIWSPVPQVDLGIEYARSAGELESGQRGEQSRINAEAVFRF